MYLMVFHALSLYGENYTHSLQCILKSYASYDWIMQYIEHSHSHYKSHLEMFPCSFCGVQCFFLVLRNRSGSFSYSREISLILVFFF